MKDTVSYFLLGVCLSVGLIFGSALAKFLLTWFIGVV